MAEENVLEQRIARLEAVVAALVVTDADMLSEDVRELLRYGIHYPEPPYGGIWAELLDLLRYRRASAERSEQAVSALYGLQSQSREEMDRLRQDVNRSLTLADDVRRTGASVTQRIQSLEQRTSEEFARSRRQLTEYLVPLSLGLPLDELPLHRFVPVRVFLRRGNPSTVEQVSAAIAEALNSLGFEISDSFPAESGSWFKRWTSRSPRRRSSGRNACSASGSLIRYTLQESVDYRFAPVAIGYGSHNRALGTCTVYIREHFSDYLFS